MGYLNDYVFYSSGNECPESFQIWSGLSLLGAVLGRKIWTMHGDYFKIYPQVYVCLVGDAGSGKSTAKGVAKSIFVKSFPDLKFSASIQSREDIIDIMASDECIQTWKDATGNYGDKDKIYEYRPYYIIANELASFLSVDKIKMVEFLVDVYDENFFSTGFKGQRLANPDRKQMFENPCVSMLACAVPKWFMGNLKLDLFEGGLGRRLIIVYDEKGKLVDHPTTPEGGNAALLRAIEHLTEASRVYGRLDRTTEAMSFWKSWYHNPRRRNREDPILMQFHETKPIQVLKVATLLAMSERPFTMRIEAVHLEAAVSMLDTLEPRIVQLTSGIGRNELAGVGAQLIDYLDRMGGAVSLVQVKKFFNRYMNNPEFREVIQHHVDVGDLALMNCEWEGIRRDVMARPGHKLYEAFHGRVAGPPTGPPSSPPLTS